MPTEVTIWDVRKGSAVSVRTPDGNYIWCDAGGGGPDGDKFSPYRHMGSPYLDVFIISRPHGDHLFDLRNIPMENIGRVVFNPYTELFFYNTVVRENIYPDAVTDPYLKFIVFQKEIKCGRIAAYQADNGESMKVHAFCAMEHVGSKGSNIDNHTVVIFLEHGRNVVCIPGNIKEPGWDYLFRRYYDFEKLLGKTTILIASQCGHRECLHRDYPDNLKPEFVVIQVKNEDECLMTQTYERMVRRNGFSKKEKSGSAGSIWNTLTGGSVRLHLNEDGYMVSAMP